MTVVAEAGGKVTVVGTQYGVKLELELLEVVAVVVAVELVAIQEHAEEYLDAGYVVDLMKFGGSVAP